jgi:hypothetical protein
MCKYRIAKRLNQYQPQKLVYANVKWWQRQTKEWRHIDENGVIPYINILSSKLFYDTFDEALNIINKNKEKHETEFYYF